MSGSLALQVWWALGVLSLVVYIVGGLLVSGVGASVWLALLRAPFYVLWKLALRLGGPRGQGEWVRTARDVQGGSRAMMNLVLSIVGMSLAIALFAPKLDWRAYTGLGVWVVGACAFYYMKH